MIKGKPTYKNPDNRYNQQKMPIESSNENELEIPMFVIFQVWVIN